MSSGLEWVFRRAADRHAPVLVGFLPAGYPDEGLFEQAVAAGTAAGVNAWELWLDGPPPELEGPTIKEAIARAPSGLTSRLAAAAAARRHAPVIGVVYGRTLSEGRVGARIKRLLDSGVPDVMAPDLNIRRQLMLVERWPGQVGVFVASPDDLEPLRKTDARPSFVYLRSSSRTTGEPIALERATTRLADLTRVLASRHWPIVVGFGIHLARDVGHLYAAGADGVVVGSAVVRAAHEGPTSVADAIHRLLPFERAGL